MLRGVKDMNTTSGGNRIDWAGTTRSFVVAWGLPIAAMVLSIFLDPIPKTIVWIVALGWMGTACLLMPNGAAAFIVISRGRSSSS